MNREMKDKNELELRVIVAEIQKDVSFIKESVQRFEEVFVRYEDRVRSIESWKDQLTGKMAIVSGIIAVIISFIFDFIKSRV